MLDMPRIVPFSSVWIFVSFLLNMKEELKRRTKKIGIDIIRLSEDPPEKLYAAVICKQLLRCATSIGANYRAACRAKSTADYINKLKIVEEEADETLYWLEISEELDMFDKNKLRKVSMEVNEIVAITVSSIKTLRQKYFRK